MQQAKFGKAAAGSTLDRVKRSPNFREGRFQNIHHTPNLTEGVSYFAVMKEFLFKKNKRKKPAQRLPSKKTDLLSLDPLKEVLVWFGHSSYFLQVDGKKILVDPVLSGAASPVKSTTLSFDGADIYTSEDFPEIDYLFISHNHWDHLDYEIVLKLKPKIKKLICSLGLKTTFEYWGYDADKVIEMDWYEEVIPEPGFRINSFPARHFSGRGFKRNQTLWSSFALQTPGTKIFLGGDSGYDTHFAEIGKTHGPFDLAILECGQYHPSWKYIHMMPEEVIQAALDIKAIRLMPVHWGKFALSNHDWDDPILRVTAAAKLKNLPLLTPMIGEAVNLKSIQAFEPWWQGL